MPLSLKWSFMDRLLVLVLVGFAISNLFDGDLLIGFWMLVAATWQSLYLSADAAYRENNAP